MHRFPVFENEIKILLLLLLFFIVIFIFILLDFGGIDIRVSSDENWDLQSLVSKNVQFDRLTDSVWVLLPCDSIYVHLWKASSLSQVNDLHINLKISHDRLYE
jgi:hypothetical protein